MPDPSDGVKGSFSEPTGLEKEQDAIDYRNGTEDGAHLPGLGRHQPAHDEKRTNAAPRPAPSGGDAPGRPPGGTVGSPDPGPPRPAPSGGDAPGRPPGGTVGSPDPKTAPPRPTSSGGGTGDLSNSSTRMAPSPRSASTGLFALAALAGIAAVAAFAGVGPFAAQANAVAGTTVPATVAPAAVAPTPFVPIGPGGKPLPVGSGTISFALPARYGTGVSITEYLCQNTFLTSANPNATFDPLGDPAMGIRGLLNGHTFQALFSATQTFVGFENVSLTPAMRGGPMPTYVQGQHVAGTVAVHSDGPDNAGNPLFSGTVTVDFTCTGGAAPAASVAAAGPVVPVEPTQNGPSPWGPGLGVVAVAAATAGFVTRARGGAVLSTALAGQRQQKAAPDCSQLEAALRELQSRLGRYQARADAAWLRAQNPTPLSPEQLRKEMNPFYTSAGTGPTQSPREPRSEAEAQDFAHWAAQQEAARLQGALDNLKNKIFDVHTALEKCLAGVGPDVVPMTLHEDYEPTWSDAGFDPTPPDSGESAEPDDPEDHAPLG